MTEAVDIAADLRCDERDRESAHQPDERVHDDDRPDDRQVHVEPAHERVNQIREEQRADREQSGAANGAEKIQHADEQVDRHGDQRQHLEPVGDAAFAARGQPAAQFLDGFGIDHAFSGRTMRANPISGLRNAALSAATGTFIHAGRP